MVLSACGQSSTNGNSGVAGKLDSFEHLEGFVDLYWDAADGRLYMIVERFGAPILHQSSLPRGIGSNDIGLDRGQLGDTRIVEFERVGPKVLMIEQNLRYRALSDNPDEQNAVDESFARSVIWGFESKGELDGASIIDITDFALSDAHSVAARLSQLEEGEYSIDASRSAIYRPRTKAFPDNTEVEAIVTYSGKPAGELLPTVVPDPQSITVHLHHSFIRLPDDNYEPVRFDPRSGLIGLRYGSDGFFDYASAIDEPLASEFGRRHRLEKKDPSADRSEAVEPIVYYLDRGAPEPVRQALLEGASWWNEAFEAAGYIDAFQVRMLPEGADPMDVRYNVIQWVHRSTRGWSYGSSIVDPRTGEIMKGHVTLGSLRVRQDFMIAEGLLAPYTKDYVPEDMLEMSLARIRQLSAHEVGHTLGFAHNFAASTQGRASVMDYPFPLVRFDGGGDLDLDEAYATGMGEWDKRSVLYAYSDFPDVRDPHEERERIMAETIEMGLRFVSDADSRDPGTAHPWGNLWDNGENAIDELEHLLRVRTYALRNFSEDVIQRGRPHATIEEALVPIYLLHRYQIRAVGKLIGGHYFTYALRGDEQVPTTPVSAADQRAAILALLNTIDPAVLVLPESLPGGIPPRPPGHGMTREMFPRTTGVTFDPVGPARSAVTLTLDSLLHPARAARMVAGHAADPRLPGFDELTGSILGATWFAGRLRGMQGVVQRSTSMLVLERFLALSVDPSTSSEVRALAVDAIALLQNWLEGRVRDPDPVWRAHFTHAQSLIRQLRENPERVQGIAPVGVPPGSPIGAAQDHN
ncbi:MAG: zinc-dependent metalloprotease [Gammaproteobacteria bacterium]|nr:zinc-dependent metalloprotease [Gammaproteobacteria bacterium]